MGDLPDTISYPIRSDNLILLSSGRDVPPERLYKIVWVDQKGVLNPDLVSAA